MDLIDFFVDQHYTAADSQSAEEPRLVIVEEKAQYGAIVKRCREGLAAVASGGYLAVVLRLDGVGLIRRVMNFSILPIRVARVKRAIINSGATEAGIFGISPNVSSPTIIYPIGGSEARYARTQLLPTVSSPLAMFREALAWWAGCDICIGALIIIGRKP